MDQDKIIKLIEKLNVYSRKHPGRYKRKVWRLAAAGYFYLLFILAILGALVGAFAYYYLYTESPKLTTLKFSIPVLLLFLAILKAAWIRIPPPWGLEVNLDAFPHLKNALDEIKKRLNGPKIHSVKITDEFNAAIVQTPRLGILGWQKNHLILGLPMVQSLSMDEFKAVVAHEYGHLAGAHGKFAAKIYRVRGTWARLHEAIGESHSWSGWIFNGFIKRFAPYFNIYTFVLARSNEYDADAASADIVGAETTASSLIRVVTMGALFEKYFWKSVFDEAASSEVPPDEVLTRVRPFLEKIDNDKLVNMRNLAMIQETGFDDTHPALKDRLSALGCDFREPLAVHVSAASHFLGEQEKSISDAISTAWKNQVADGWTEHRESVLKNKQKLSELKTEVEQGKVALKDYLEYAYLTEEMEGPEKAFVVFKSILETEPESADALFHMGRILMDQEDDTGIEYLQKAAKADEDLEIHVYPPILQYLTLKNRQDELKSYKEKYEKALLHAEKVLQEKESLTGDNEFEPHNLEQETVQSLATQLREFPTIDKAYVVQKKLHLSKKPIYVIGLTRTRIAGILEHTDITNERVVQGVVNTLDFEGQFVCVVIDSNRDPLGKRLPEIPDSFILNGKQ
ncbi:MAG: M48 family metallopeptidase [Leptospirales bacterium]